MEKFYPWKNIAQQATLTYPTPQEEPAAAARREDFQKEHHLSNCLWIGAAESI